MVITTSIGANYLPKVLVLAKSIKRNIKNAIFIVCFVERELPGAALEAIEQGVFDHAVLAKDLGFEDDFNRFIFKHTIVEAATSVKGMLMKHLYDRFPKEDRFIYLDPDCKVYGDMPELWELMNQRPIILSPHLLHPGHIEMEIYSLKNGVYNLGFLAVNRMQEARKFLEWWSERLYSFCYDEVQNGLYTDQKWVDLAPTFFDVEVLHHNGYNFGTWAIKDVTISKEDDLYFINQHPLRFTHFSGFDGGTVDKVKREWLSGKNRDLYQELVDNYTKELYQNGYSILNKVSWSYERYYSGELVSRETRIAYRNEKKLRWQIDDPYKYSDKWFVEKLGITKDEPRWATLAKKIIDQIVKEGIAGLLIKIMKTFIGKVKSLFRLLWHLYGKL